VIDTEHKLADFLPRLATADWIALDTEADSLHAYPEKLCLIQVSIPRSDLLVDPLAGLELAPFFKALHGRELIMHGADYDLRLLRRSFDFVPHAIFDTMWAARLVGIRQFSFNGLVGRYLGVKLEKGSQKANWARRPLTERMMAYARNDTHYLKPLADALRAELERTARLAWHRECCARLIAECAQIKHPDADTVWRVTGSHRLDRGSLAVLRELWHWREQEAILANKPPYFILPHEKLATIAALASAGKSFQHLLPRLTSPRRRALLLEAVHTGLAVLPEHQPHPLRSSGRRLNEREKRRLTDLTHRRDRHARDLDLDPTLIASRSTLVALARDGAKPHAELMNWQRELLVG
jgi:ribonuclease D